MMRVSIAIDNSLYYQFTADDGDVVAQVITRVRLLSGNLWNRVEWYTIVGQSVGRNGRDDYWHDNTLWSRLYSEV